MRKLEICCYSCHDAVIAEQHGADRIELCQARHEGGLTPSYGELQLARQSLTIPVYPMVRPRGGDFCYNESDINVMLNDIALIADMGFAGIVLGVLTDEGDIANSLLQRLLHGHQTLEVTFHRAFDLCRAPLQALQQLSDIGITRILTSGQQAKALQGLDLLEQLNTQSQGPIIMAGSGIHSNNIDLFLQRGIKEIHASASQRLPAKASYSVSMSHGSSADEFARYQVDANEVVNMKIRCKAYP